MPVYYGLSPDLERLSRIAKKYNIPLINDAAPAYGATCNDISITEYADITSYSLENSKHITTGDGGIM